MNAEIYLLYFIIIIKIYSLCLFLLSKNTTLMLAILNLIFLRKLITFYAVLHSYKRVFQSHLMDFVPTLE